MPRVSSFFRRLFPLSLPSVSSYIAFSTFLFGIGLYYYYRISKVLNNNLLENENFLKADEFVDGDDQAVVDFVKKLSVLLQKHRLLFYVLINSCCAVICILGKALISVMFGVLTNQEESMLRKYFRRFVSTKLTFLVFISHHNLFEDISIWTPWLAMHALCLLLLELTNLRLANAHNVISNRAVRQRLFATATITGASSMLMLVFVTGIRDYINVNYCLFLGADCSLLLLQSMHLLAKIFMLVDANAQRLQGSPTSSYYLDLAYEMIRDCLEFANYLHMIFYSQLAITYCCVFLIVQAQHYYRRISSKVRKYLQQQELMRHISSNYVIATEEDLLKSDQCTICWQSMKSARKLPCSHIFHEHCLRRWLEQDSSCAICRKTLTLNLTRSQQQQQVNIAGEENGIQLLFEAFSPQNNRLARWWTRFLFESMNEDQVAEMVTQVSEMFPQVPVDTIRQLITRTGSIAVTVEVLLNGGNGQNANNNNNQQPNQVEPNIVVQVGDSSTDETYESSADGTDSEPEENQMNGRVQQQTVPLVVQQQPSDLDAVQSLPRLPFNLKTNNAWLEQQMHALLAINRRKYLESQRGAEFGGSKSKK